MGSPARYACCEKEMLGWIQKKWLLKNQPQEMIGFLSLIQEHLLLVCPNRQKVMEQFCSALPLTHISTLAKLMQITNIVALAKFVACY
jgi:hypothetical protein